MRTPGAGSITSPGVIPADRVHCGPMMHPSPMAMYSSPYSAVTGKQITDRAPKCRNRCADALPGRMEPTSASRSHATRTTPPATARARSTNEVTLERNPPRDPPRAPVAPVYDPRGRADGHRTGSSTRSHVDRTRGRGRHVGVRQAPGGAPRRWRSGDRAGCLRTRARPHRASSRTPCSSRRPSTSRCGSRPRRSCSRPCRSCSPCACTARSMCRARRHPGSATRTGSWGRWRSR